jgi:hypothetical protein
MSTRAIKLPALADLVLWDASEGFLNMLTAARPGVFLASITNYA